MPRFAVALVVLAFASSALAQVVYEPVKYQYWFNGNVIYYGGSNPRAVHNAEGPVSAGGTWGRVDNSSFSSGNWDTYRSVSPDTIILTDALPNRNARFFGYTGTDAYNDAYQSLPGYYRKSDLLRSGQVDAKGTLVVPPNAPLASAGTIDIRPYNAAAKRTTSPNPVIIIPKDMLDKPLSKPDAGAQKVVLAK